MIPLYNAQIPKQDFLTSLSDLKYLNFGDSCLAFERNLKKLFNCQHVLVTNSYTGAWSSFLDSLRLNANDEIVASPLACLASTQPLTKTSAKLVWSDVNKKTGLMDSTSLLEVITNRTKIVVVSLFCGYVPDLEGIWRAAKKVNAIVVLDLIEATGSWYEEQLVGSQYCDLAIVSTDATRTICSNQGGAILLHDNGLYRGIKLARDFGIDRELFRDSLGEIDRECDVKISALDHKQNEINSRIGLDSLKSFRIILSRQQENNQAWRQVLNTLEMNIDMLNPLEKTIPNYWVQGMLANDLHDAILHFRSKGFYASKVHLRNDHYTLFKNSKRSLPGVENFTNKFFALPSGWWVNKKEILSLCE